MGRRRGQEEQQHEELKASFDSLLALYETTRQINAHQATQEDTLLAQLRQVEEEKRALLKRLENAEGHTEERLTSVY